MEINDYIKKGQINAIKGFAFDQNYVHKNMIFIANEYPDVTVKKYVLDTKRCSSKRFLDSLKMVNLDSSIGSKQINELASSDQLKLELAMALIDNREQLNFYYFDAFFNEKELLFFKQLLIKLVKHYHKTIVLFDSNLDFLLNLVDNLVILTKENTIRTFGKEDLFSQELELYFDLPPIMEFTKYINTTKKNIGNYTELKELLKAIYRSV